jgi:hypothetical protein
VAPALATRGSQASWWRRFRFCADPRVSAAPSSRSQRTSSESGDRLGSECSFRSKAAPPGLRLAGSEVASRPFRCIPRGACQAAPPPASALARFYERARLSGSGTAAGHGGHPQSCPTVATRLETAGEARHFLPGSARIAANPRVSAHFEGSGPHWRPGQNPCKPRSWKQDARFSFRKSHPGGRRFESA